MSFDQAIVSEKIAFNQMVRGPYIVASRGILSDEQATELIRTLRLGDHESPRGTLGGRSKSFIFNLSGFGRVFVKHYSHGGVLRSITGGRFLAIGEQRSRLEFEMLERARSLGVNAPRPLAIITKGAIVYGTWLVMEELGDTRSLVEVQNEDGDDLRHAMDELGKQLGLLIKNQIFHVDLHPGNVLVSGDGKAFIVDFDKARIFSGGESALRELYLRRWRRAVIKHKLSPVLSEMMSLTLRSYGE
jgi:3-deoxy-D-manno-octulosonic acid kinase